MKRNIETDGQAEIARRKGKERKCRGRDRVETKKKAKAGPQMANGKLTTGKTKAAACRKQTGNNQ